MKSKKPDPKTPPPYRGTSNQACRVCGHGPDALRHRGIGGHRYVAPRKKIG